MIKTSRNLFKLLYWLILIMSFDSAKAAAGTMPLTKKFLLNQSLGIYTLKIERNNHQGYELSIFDQTEMRIQTLNVESSVPPDSLISIIDVDGDGYKDLVISDGYNAGPFPLTSLYRFNPSTKLFEEDTSFPGNGVPTPSSTIGCIYLEDRHPGGDADYYYEITEWCLSPVTKEWLAGEVCDNHTKKTCPSCTSPNRQSCYKKIDGYRKIWWKQHSDKQ